MKSRLGNILKFAGFLSIGAAILTYVFYKQDAAYQAQCAYEGIAAQDCSLLGKLAGDLATVNYWWLAALLVIFMVSNWFRAVRWQQLIEPLGKRVSFGNSFWSVMIGYFANLGFPRAGEVVRAGVLSRYEGVPVEKVMGTVVVDRILDVICLLVVVGIAFLVQWELLSGMIFDARADDGAPADGFGLVSYLVLALAVAALVLGLMVWGYRKFKHVTIVQRFGKLARGFLDGLRSLTQVKSMPKLVGNTVGIWGCYFLMAYVPFFAYPPTAHLGYDAALMVFIFSALGIVIPSPGGLGSYHFMVIQALAIYNINGADALSFANILFFTINIGCNILFGLIGLLVLPMLNGGKHVNLAETTELQAEPEVEAA